MIAMENIIIPLGQIETNDNYVIHAITHPNIIKNINLSHFFPRNKNIRVRWCNDNKNVYFCRITQITIQSGTVRVEALIKKEDYLENKNARFNDDELLILRKNNNIEEEKINRYNLLDFE